VLRKKMPRVGELIEERGCSLVVPAHLDVPPPIGCEPHVRRLDRSQIEKLRQDRHKRDRQQFGQMCCWASSGVDSLGARTVEMIEGCARFRHKP
jgi:hypothetical protein